ncbi:MAG: acetyl-CoA carboxylase, biotin carboxyl carrier protein [Phycisphaerae bacterium]|jgi:acetyl-CoA carboxylase biotin carboxyl carrier protein|nr:MAG: acetyl-CoA carboxylase, biotin carboxyl carrier protein [Phycisphaerae bacterium]
MNLDLLEQLVKLMSANDLNTVDLRDGDQRVVLRRGPRYVASAGPTVQASPVSPASIPAPSNTPNASSGSVGGDTASPSDDESGLIAIKSPMVGTFYAKPNPDAKNFVNVGSVVNEDTDVCIIEAMKVFNNIKAECRGTIVKILAEDGKPVEFGQVLFLVKPS